MSASSEGSSPPPHPTTDCSLSSLNGVTIIGLPPKSAPLCHLYHVIWAFCTSSSGQLYSYDKYGNDQAYIHCQCHKFFFGCWRSGSCSGQVGDMDDILLPTT